MQAKTRLTPFSFTALQLVALARHAAAHRPFLNSVPNGHAFENEWPALGHVAPQPAEYMGRGFPRNPFGIDFRAAGLRWTASLCQKDSDGDGLSNGEELGDPSCVWQPGDADPTPTGNLSHPGLPHVGLGGTRAYWSAKLAELESAPKPQDLSGVEVDHGLLIDTSPLAPEVFYYHYVLIPIVATVALLLLCSGAKGAHRPSSPVVIVATYVIGHIGVFVGNHRCYSHRSFEPSQTGHMVLAMLSAAAAQGPATHWAFYHRVHHEYCESELDLHSPTPPKNFFWAQGGYLVNTSRHLSLAPRNYNHVIGDLLLNPSIPRWNTNVDEHIKMHIRIILLVVAAIALYHFLHTSRRELASHRAKTVAPWPLCFRLRVTLVSTFCSAAFHFFLPVCLSMQITHLVNSAVHMWGDVPYADGMSAPCTSKNNAFLVWPMLGENWHNNHHSSPSSPSNWVAWYQFDFQAITIHAFYHVGLIRQMNDQPSRRFRDGYEELPFYSVLLSWLGTLTVMLLLPRFMSHLAPKLTASLMKRGSVHPGSRKLSTSEGEDSTVALTSKEALAVAVVN